MSNKEKETIETMDRNSNNNEDIELQAEMMEEGLDENQAGVNEDLGEEAVHLKQIIDDVQNRLLRTQADFENYKKRTRIEKEELAKYAATSIVTSLLSALDNFERALQASNEAKDIDSLVQGVEMVYRQIQDSLTKEGLETIEAVGQPFNPELHQAVMQVESPDFASGVVIEEFQRGYKYKGKVIRPSMVKVNA